jgi:hypothetical protein
MKLKKRDGVHPANTFGTLLTVSEIFDALAVNYEQGSNLEQTMIDHYPDMDWTRKFMNDDTGFSCQIAAYNSQVEFEGKDGEPIYAWHYRYLVEMEIEGRFVMVEWLRRDPSSAEIEFIKNSAHKTFINMCGFIGVKVGYELAKDPEEY